MTQVLVVDVGGSHVKILASGQTEPRRVDSGPQLTPARMVQQVQALAEGWRFDALSIGYPGPVRGGPSGEPPNLGPGWVGFDFAKAFGKPVKLVNDAAMQALGSHQRGKMLFLGLGTGLGSALVVRGLVLGMELAHLPYRRSSFEDHVGARGLQRLGHKKWRERVIDVARRLEAALVPDEVVLGGGNSRLLDDLPEGWRTVANTNAFIGGFRLWGSSSQDPAASGTHIQWTAA